MNILIRTIVSGLTAGVVGGIFFTFCANLSQFISDTLLIRGGSVQDISPLLLSSLLTTPLGIVIGGVIGAIFGLLIGLHLLMNQGANVSTKTITIYSIIVASIYPILSFIMSLITNEQLLEPILNLPSGVISGLLASVIGIRVFNWFTVQGST